MQWQIGSPQFSVEGAVRWEPLFALTAADVYAKTADVVVVLVVVVVAVVVSR